MKKLLFLVLVLGIPGCGYNWVEESNINIENIESVFLNEPNDYTVLYKKGNELVARKIDVPRYYICGFVKIQTDAP